MSLLRYFSRVERSTEEAYVTPWVPDLQVCRTSGEKRAFSSANEKIHQSESTERQTKCKRGSYSFYDKQLRLQIGKYAAENGNLAAVRHFSVGREKPLSESTVRSMKAAYQKELRIATESRKSLQCLPRKQRGPTTLLGDLEKDVLVYIQELRNAGGIVNSRICIAAATGILQALKQSLLSEFGGVLSLNKTWAQSFLRRHGFVKRKGTRAARKVPED